MTRNNDEAGSRVDRQWEGVRLIATSSANSLYYNELLTHHSVALLGVINRSSLYSFHPLRGPTIPTINLLITGVQQDRTP